MYLRAEGLRPESVRCTRPPEALGFPTQLPGEVLLATIRAWKILFSAQKASLKCCLHVVALTAHAGKK